MEYVRNIFKNEEPLERTNKTYLVMIPEFRSISLCNVRPLEDHGKGFGEPVKKQLILPNQASFVLLGRQARDGIIT